MREVILQKLQEIEQAEGVTILHAVESGSRAWGFPSPDSDYDVRFFYVRSTEYYLRLDRTRDVIERPIDEVLDINGWDLDKALRLLHASNPTLFEWSQSPIVYRTTELFQSFLPTIRTCFSAKPGLWHYLSMAEGNYREYLKVERVKAKSIFTSSAPSWPAAGFWSGARPLPCCFPGWWRPSWNRSCGPWWRICSVLRWIRRKSG